MNINEIVLNKAKEHGLINPEMFLDFIHALLAEVEKVKAQEAEELAIKSFKVGCYVDSCKGEECVLNPDNKKGMIPSDCTCPDQFGYTKQEQCIHWKTKP